MLPLEVKILLCLGIYGCNFISSSEWIDQSTWSMMNDFDEFFCLIFLDLISCFASSLVV